MPQTARLQLHYINANRRRNRLPGRRDSRHRSHCSAHLRKHLGTALHQLRARQRTHSLHQLFHQPLISYQLRHLLWHVASVPRDLPGSVFYSTNLQGARLPNRIEFDEFIDSDKESSEKTVTNCQKECIFTIRPLRLTIKIKNNMKYEYSLKS